MRAWLSHAPIGVGLAIVVMLVLAGLQNHYRHSQRHQGTSSYQQYGTAEGVPDVRIAPITPPQPPPPEPEPDRQEWRSEQDLQAQRDMAEWAFFAMIAAGAGVFITGVGIVFLKFTLDANRAAVGAAVNANKTAREVGEAQVRAYLAIEDVTVTADPEANCLQIGFAVRNLGNSPAQDFNYCFLVKMFRVPQPGETAPKVYERENKPQFPNFPANGDRRIRMGGMDALNHLVTDFRFTSDEIAFLKKESLWVNVSIATRFRDVFDKTISEIEHFHRLGGLRMNQVVPFTSISYSNHSMVRLWVEHHKASVASVARMERERNPG